MAIHATLTPHDVEQALSEAQRIVEQECLGIEQRSRTALTANEITQALSRFSDVISQSSAGSVAEAVAAISLAILESTDREISSRRKELLGRLARVVRHRPLPALLWADFAATNWEQPQVVREAFLRCIHAKLQLSSRIGRVALLSEEAFATPKRIVALGYSKTLADAAEGLNNRTGSGLTVLIVNLRRPGFRKDVGSLMSKELDRRGISYDVVDEDSFDASLLNEEVDMVMTGCKVMAEDPFGITRFVNSYPWVRLLRAIRARTSVAVVLTTGLYKAWPWSFFEENEQSFVLDPRQSDGQPINDVLYPSDVDWILTERLIAPSPLFPLVHPLVQRMFRTSDFSVRSEIDALPSWEDLSGIIEETRMERFSEGVGERFSRTALKHTIELVTARSLASSVDLDQAALQVDSLAIDLLRELEAQGEVSIDAFGRWEQPERRWIALARIARARLVEEVDDAFVLSSRGRRHFSGGGRGQDSDEGALVLASSVALDRAVAAGDHECREVMARIAQVGAMPAKDFGEFFGTTAERLGFVRAMRARLVDDHDTEFVLSVAGREFFRRNRSSARVP